MSNKIEFNGEEVEIPSFGVYLFEQAKKEAYNKALDDVLKFDEMCGANNDDCEKCIYYYCSEDKSCLEHFINGLRSKGE